MSLGHPLASDQPGYFEIYEGALGSGWYCEFNCPCGCKYGDIVPLRRDNEQKAGRVGWSWDGNLKMPTLGPSLKRHTPCGFHGYLLNGIWSACDDGAPLSPNVYRGVP